MFGSYDIFFLRFYRDLFNYLLIDFNSIQHASSMDECILRLIDTTHDNEMITLFKLNSYALMYGYLQNYFFAEKENKQHLFEYQQITEIIKNKKWDKWITNDIRQFLCIIATIRIDCFDNKNKNATYGKKTLESLSSHPKHRNFLPLIMDYLYESQRLFTYHANESSPRHTGFMLPLLVFDVAFACFLYLFVWFRCFFCLSHLPAFYICLFVSFACLENWYVFVCYLCLCFVCYLCLCFCVFLFVTFVCVLFVTFVCVLLRFDRTFFRHI